ncbi:MAG TPA: lipid-transfer protein [Mycobacteriales bacterium]|nr:lipid-transfer protein [Mycobacteriales bacterium]
MQQFARDVAIVASASFETPSEPARNEVEILLPVIHDALAQVGLTQQDIGFTVSGSSDYLQGFPFAFVGALDAVGAWPPIRESHLEMDGAFALYEAVEVLQHGEIDTALVYAFARPSRGELDRTLAIQLDPYTVAPLWPDARGLAGLQAQAMRDSGKYADVPDATPTYVADGATAVVLAAGDRARQLTKTPAWIRGIDHRIEPPALGVRDLTVSVSTQQAATGAGVAAAPVDAAFLHVLYPHQELLLREALGLNGQPVDAKAGPMMVGGLERIAAAAKSLAGSTRRVVAHATSGACLQQNLVAVLEGEAA